MRELLTIEEVAERLRVKVLTIRWLRQEGRFPPAIKVGRRLVWDAADLEVWIEAQREPEQIRSAFSGSSAVRRCATAPA
jgi:excisionase family DNA binding protein